MSSDFSGHCTEHRKPITMYFYRLWYTFANLIKITKRRKEAYTTGIDIIWSRVRFPGGSTRFSFSLHYLPTAKQLISNIYLKQKLHNVQCVIQSYLSHDQQTKTCYLLQGVPEKKKKKRQNNKTTKSKTTFNNNKQTTLKKYSKLTSSLKPPHLQPVFTYEAQFQHLPFPSALHI